jgi:hypothetical protein
MRCLARLIAVASVVVLAMIIVARTTPAWSATTCPTPLVAPNTYMPNTGYCGEELLEEDEERLEEELEVQEDAEEERAIATERAARAAADAAEETTEEAQEQAGQEGPAAHLPYRKSAFKLRVSVLTRRGHPPLHPGETRILVTTSVPAQVKLVLQAHRGPVRLFRWKSTQGRKYALRVPWTCHTQAGRYTFTVTADRENDRQPSIGDMIVRRRTFTIYTHTTCSKNQTGGR